MRWLKRYAVTLADSGLRPIPVLTLGDATEYRTAIAPLSSYSEIGLRLFNADLVQGALAAHLDQFLLTTGHMPPTVHVIADFAAHYRDVDIAALCGSLPYIGLYRTLTVAAGSFPLDLREYRGPQTLYLPRHEWVRYQHQVGGQLPRRPTFGDYATIHPVLTKSAKGLNPSATIRYTTDDAWLVMKGEGLHNEDGPGYEQYPANATLLTRSRDYKGSQFSAGDRYITDVASHKAPPGTPTSWVQAGVNHHLTFVCNQVSELFRAAAALGADEAPPVQKIMQVRERSRPFGQGLPAEPRREIRNREKGEANENTRGGAE